MLLQWTFLLFEIFCRKYTQKKPLPRTEQFTIHWNSIWILKSDAEILSIPFIVSLSINLCMKNDLFLFQHCNKISVPLVSTNSTKYCSIFGYRLPICDHFIITVISYFDCEKYQYAITVAAVAVVVVVVVVITVFATVVWWRRPSIVLTIKVNWWKAW